MNPIFLVLIVILVILLVPIHYVWGMYASISDFVLIAILIAIVIIFSERKL